MHFKTTASHLQIGKANTRKKHSIPHAVIQVAHKQVNAIILYTQTFFLQFLIRHVVRNFWLWWGYRLLLCLLLLWELWLGNNGYLTHHDGLPSSAKHVRNSHCCGLSATLLDFQVWKGKLRHFINASLDTFSSPSWPWFRNAVYCWTWHRLHGLLHCHFSAQDPSIYDLWFHMRCALNIDVLGMGDVTVTVIYTITSELRQCCFSEFSMITKSAHKLLWCWKLMPWTYSAHLTGSEGRICVDWIAQHQCTFPSCSSR